MHPTEMPTQTQHKADASPQQESQAMDSNEMSLREHLLAAQAGPAPPSHNSYSPHQADQMRPSTSGSPHHEAHIDPAIAGALQGAHYALNAGDNSDDQSPDSKRVGKRELSTSKRAAQNRAAQRAFRQRKEGYIKKLEEENRAMHALNENFKQIQAENYQLRDYVISLQSRLIESQGEYPQPPIDLRDPRTSEPLPMPASAVTMGQSAVSQLQAAAAAAQAEESESIPASNEGEVELNDKHPQSLDYHDTEMQA